MQTGQMCFFHRVWIPSFLDDWNIFLVKISPSQLDFTWISSMKSCRSILKKEHFGASQCSFQQQAGFSCDNNKNLSSPAHQLDRSGFTSETIISEIDIHLNTSTSHSKYWDMIKKSSGWGGAILGGRSYLVTSEWCHHLGLGLNLGLNLGMWIFKEVVNKIAQRKIQDCHFRETLPLILGNFCLKKTNLSKREMRQN